MHKRIIMKKHNHYYVGILFLSLVTLTGCFKAISSYVGMSIDMNQVIGKTNIMPIAVIGSGPAGLMAALYGARGGKDTFVIHGNKPGGLLMDTTEVENWPGETSVTGPEIIEKLEKQAAHHGVTFIDDAVERINVSAWPYTLYTENGDIFYALSIIIATGASPRPLDIPGEEDYWGMGVTACAVCDAPFYKGLEAVVIGGGDSAVEEAIQLASYAKKITILVRKNSMRAAAQMQTRLKSYPNISIRYNVQVHEIIGDGTQVTGVGLSDTTTGKKMVLPTKGVFLAIGHTPNSSFVRDAVETDKAGYIIVKGRTQATSKEGIFAAGDVQDHMYRQAGSSAGYGIDAGLDAVHFLDDHGYTPIIAAQIKSYLYGTIQMQKNQEYADQVQSLETADQLDAFVGQEGMAVLDFWGETCPSCKQMMPSFHAVAQEYADQARFATVDSDAAPEIVEKLLVYKVPCLVVFRNGQIIARYSNMMSRKELAAFIDQLLHSK